MHRIDEDANVNNLFAEADPGTGALGTRVGAPWMNDVQENLCQFMEAMGITLSKGDYTQLTDAVLALQGRANTWTAAQTIAALLTLSAADVNLTKAAAQAVLKTGGKLQLGTGDNNDVEVLRNNTAFMVLRSTGIDACGVAVQTVYLMGLQNITADPGSPPDGAIWYRADLGRLRARAWGSTKQVATEDWVWGVAPAQSKVIAGGRVASIDGSNVNFAAGTFGVGSGVGARTSAGVYKIPLTAPTANYFGVVNCTSDLGDVGCNPNPADSTLRVYRGQGGVRTDGTFNFIVLAGA